MLHTVFLKPADFAQLMGNILAWMVSWPYVSHTLFLSLNLLRLKKKEGKITINQCHRSVRKVRLIPKPPPRNHAALCGHFYLWERIWWWSFFTTTPSNTQTWDWGSWLIKCWETYSSEAAVSRWTLRQHEMQLLHRLLVLLHLPQSLHISGLEKRSFNLFWCHWSTTQPPWQKKPSVATASKTQTAHKELQHFY